MIPELVGRLPVITTLDALDRDTLVRIMTEPKNSVIRQYEALFQMDGVKLTFEPEALTRIADRTIERKTGARGLRSILEQLLREPMFRIPSDPTVTEIVITADTVDGGEPVLLREKAANE